MAQTLDNATRVDGPVGNTYDKYASQNPIERRLMASFFVRLDSLLPAETASIARVLEVGTGEGHVAERIVARYPNAAVAGVDLPDDELALSWRSAGLNAAFALGEALPFPDATFDLVLAVEVLEHVTDPDAVLAEIARVAKGPVVFTVPWEPVWRAANMARGKYLRDLGNTPGHINHWGKGAFRTLVGRHFDVTSCGVSFPWTLVAARKR